MTIERKTLASHIRTECQVLGQLTAVLREEQLALVRGQIETIASYSDPKARLLIELSRCAEQRARLLTEHGLTLDAAGMDQLLRMLEHDATAVIADWQRLLDDARAARQLNDINGTLIATRMRGTQRALGVLLTAARIPGTYAADGTTVGLPGARRLAVA